MSITAKELSNGLYDVIEKMIVPARELGDDTTAITLERQAASLKKGLVRVALIGNTSSGKSTVINALLRQIVVPENPSVCSPVPVWIYHHEGEERMVEVVRADEKGTLTEQFTPREFMTKCCYNVAAIKGANRKYYDSMKEASMALESDILATGAILIDTLGTAASNVDTAKTLAVLNEGVDLVVFVSKNAVLHQDEIRFLREYVLGYEPDKHKVNYPVDPKNLIFVLNDFSTMPRPRAPFVAGTLKLFSGQNVMEPEEHEEWAETNIFDIQALFARLMQCKAVYPYDALAPEGSTEEEKQELIERMEGEQGVLAYCASMPNSLKKSGIEELQNGLKKHIARRSVGRDSVALGRIQRLTDVLIRIKEVADQRIQSRVTTAAELKALQQDIQDLKGDNDQAEKSIRQALNTLKGQYIKGFNNVFDMAFGPGGTQRNALSGLVLQYAMPEDFKNNFNIRAFLKMSDADKVEQLDAYVDQAVNMITAHCREAVLKDLSQRRQGADGIKTPFEVLEDSRQYVMAQAKSLNDRIEVLEKLGVAGKLGVMLPQKQAVEDFFINLQTALEQNLLQAISDALANGIDKFNANRNSFVNNVSGGFFKRLIGKIFPNNAKFWKNLCQDYFVPLVVYVLGSLSSFGDANVPGGLSAAVDDAYIQVLLEITKRRQDIVAALSSSLQRVEQAIQGADQAAQATANQMNAIKDACKQLAEQLNGYQTELLAQADEQDADRQNQ